MDTNNTQNQPVQDNNALNNQANLSAEPIPQNGLGQNSNATPVDNTTANTASVSSIVAVQSAPNQSTQDQQSSDLSANNTVSEPVQQTPFVAPEPTNVESKPVDEVKQQPYTPIASNPFATNNTFTPTEPNNANVQPDTQSTSNIFTPASAENNTNTQTDTPVANNVFSPDQTLNDKVTPSDTMADNNVFKPDQAINTSAFAGVIPAMNNVFTPNQTTPVEMPAAVPANNTANFGNVFNPNDNVTGIAPNQNNVNGQSLGTTLLDPVVPGQYSKANNTIAPPKKGMPWLIFIIVAILLILGTGYFVLFYRTGATFNISNLQSTIANLTGTATPTPVPTVLPTPTPIPTVVAIEDDPDLEILTTGASAADVIEDLDNTDLNKLDAVMQE